MRTWRVRKAAFGAHVLVTLAAISGLAAPTAGASPPQTGVVDLAVDAAGRLDGAAYGNESGTAIAPAGDVNGDGFQDTIVGAPNADAPGRPDSGAAYVIFGNGAPPNLDLGALGTRGFRIDGAATWDRAGIAVAGAGDVNGDGLDDVIVGSPNETFVGPHGVAYVVFGKGDTDAVDLAYVGGFGSPGIRINGANASDGAGLAVAGVGDMNGDGLADLAIGAPSSGAADARNSGTVYVIAGRPWPQTIDLWLPVNWLWRIAGANAGDQAGRAIAPANDRNGDGRPEVAVGAPYVNRAWRSDAGSAYLVFGRADGALVHLGALDANGFEIQGAAGRDWTGSSVADSGDVNGDGLDDLLVGAPLADTAGRPESGAAYVVFGTPAPATVDLANLGAGGIRIDGANSFDELGTAAARVGDVNGDGRPDVLVGAPYADNQGRADSGSAYAVFGGSALENVDLANLGAGGIRVDGAAPGDQAGSSLAGPGDIGGDGRAEAAVGAPQSDPRGRAGAGATYTVNGFYPCSPLKIGYDPASIDVTVGTAIGPLEPQIQGDPPDQPSFKISPYLPGGLAIDRTTGVIRGTPRRPQASTSYTVTLTDQHGCAANTTITIRVRSRPYLTGRVDLLFDADGEIDGALPGDQAGTSLAPAGDVNGDGLTDFVIGAPYADLSGRQNAGSAYVVFGDGAAPTLGLGTLGQRGFRIYGADATDLSGMSVAGAGDVNGDGLDDVIVGASNDSGKAPGAGAAYVVFGKEDPDPVDLGALDNRGFRIAGASANDQAGQSVAGPGDVNGDHLDDLLVGANEADGAGHSDSGSSYIVFGKSTDTTVDLAALGPGGFRIDGAAAGDQSGWSVAGAGYVNGDDSPDLVVGAPYADNNGRSGSGSSYVVFGKGTDTTVDLAALGDGGFRIDGAATGDQSGRSVGGAGDMNSDGRSDLVLGAPGADNNGRAGSGSAYLVFGKGSAVNVDLAALGSAGYRTDGAAAGESAGMSVAAAGDVNGDRRPDLLVGAPYADKTGFVDTGAAYVVFGKPTGIAPDLAALGSGGIRIDGARIGDLAGTAVAGAGQVNDDPRADVLVGAPKADPAGIGDAGAVYTVYGFYLLPIFPF